MGSGLTIEGQTPNDGRLLGIPIQGVPDATNNTLQFDAVNNVFVWVPGGGSSGAEMSSIAFPYTLGRLTTIEGAGVVKIPTDDDSVTLQLIHTTDLVEGAINSVHLEDDVTSYQNTTGEIAKAVLLISGRDSGTQERHVKIFSSPTDNSITGATLLYEFGSSAVTNVCNANDELISSPILLIQNNHFLVVQNVDDGRAGTNSINIKPSIVVNNPA